MNSNPSKGPYHYKAPSRMLWRVIRGMVPHKSKRGAAALERFKAYEGIPQPYDKIKRAVVPDALKVLRLQASHKSCTLGELASIIGWRHKETVAALEEARKEKSKAFYVEKKKKIAAKNVAAKKAGAAVVKAQAIIDMA